MNKSATKCLVTITIQSKSGDFPEDLRHIPDPPKQIYIQSNNWSGLLSRPWVAIVGSRKVTAYGRTVTTTLAGDLARAGLVVVSGLAIGVDGIAHEAALEADGLTVAVLAAGPDQIYPRQHHWLAQKILQQGGALVSEYPPGVTPQRHHFIARNRLVSGLSRAVIITEAGEKSGTLHTARFALDQGRDVYAVPGNITSSASVATNNLIKTGAQLVAESRDILRDFGLPLPPRPSPIGVTPNEHVLLELLRQGCHEGHELLASSRLDASSYGKAMTMLELSGKIRSLGADTWGIR